MHGQGLTSPGCLSAEFKAVAIAGAFFTEGKFTLPVRTHYVTCRTQGPLLKIVEHFQMVAENYET